MPIEIVVAVEIDMVPIDAVHHTGCIAYNVIAESEGSMVFRPCRLHLRFDAVDKDIVGYHILLPVMLVETRTLAIIDQVVLHADAGAALVGV